MSMVVLVLWRVVSVGTFDVFLVWCVLCPAPCWFRFLVFGCACLRCLCVKLRVR